LHAEMDVVSSGHAGHAAFAHALAAFHRIAFMDADGLIYCDPKMSIKTSGVAM
jgi:hypothetical protein